MATGDQDDITNRQYSVLPPWFPDLAAAPVLKALLDGASGVSAFIYAYLSYAALQTRIKTATDAWLDLIAWDFFGGKFVRRNGETDTSWSPRIVAEILRPRQTREAIARVMQDLTGRTPRIIELFNPGDCGGYGVVSMGGYGTGAPHVANITFVGASALNEVQIAFAGLQDPGALGYQTGDKVLVQGVGGTTEANGTWIAEVGPVGAPVFINLKGTTYSHAWTSGGTITNVTKTVSHCYGSLLFPNQYLITAYRAPSQGIPFAGGYGTYNAGYRTGITMYGDPSFISGPITDAEIYARIEETTAAGISAWTALSN